MSPQSCCPLAAPDLAKIMPVRWNPLMQVGPWPLYRTGTFNVWFLLANAFGHGGIALATANRAFWWGSALFLAIVIVLIGTKHGSHRRIINAPLHEQQAIVDLLRKHGGVRDDGHGPWMICDPEEGSTRGLVAWIPDRTHSLSYPHPSAIQVVAQNPGGERAMLVIDLCPGHEPPCA